MASLTTLCYLGHFKQKMFKKLKYLFAGNLKTVLGLTCCHAGPDRKVLRREDWGDEGDGGAVLLQVGERLEGLLLVLQVVPPEAEIRREAVKRGGQLRNPFIVLLRFECI